MANPDFAGNSERLVADALLSLAHLREEEEVFFLGTYLINFPYSNTLNSLSLGVSNCIWIRKNSSWSKNTNQYRLKSLTPSFLLFFRQIPSERDNVIEIVDFWLKKHSFGALFVWKTPRTRLDLHKFSSPSAHSFPLSQCLFLQISNDLEFSLSPISTPSLFSHM